MLEYTDLVVNLVSEFSYAYSSKDIGEGERGYSRMYHVYRDFSPEDIPTVRYGDMEESEISNYVVPMLLEYGYTYNPRFGYYERRASNFNDEMDGNSKIYPNEIYRIGEIGEHVYKHKNNLDFYYPTSDFSSLEGSLYAYLNAVNMFKYRKDIFVTISYSAKYADRTINTWLWNVIVYNCGKFMGYKLRRVFSINYDLLFNDVKKLNMVNTEADYIYYINTFEEYNKLVEEGNFCKDTYCQLENMLQGIISYCCKSLFKIVVDESAKFINEDRLVSIKEDGTGKIQTSNGKELKFICNEEHFKEYYRVIDEYFHLDGNCPVFYLIIPKDCTDLTDVRYCNEHYQNDNYAVTFEGISIK